MAETITTQRVDFHVPLDTRLSFLVPTMRELEKVLWSGKAEVTLGLIAAQLILETDACLMLYDLLMRRPKNVKLTTVAMTSMLEANVLIWLTGDVLVMRPDSWVMWTPPVVDRGGKGITRNSKTKGREAFEIEDSRICELITRRLPKHLAGRMIFHAELSEWIDVQPTRKDCFGRYEVAKAPAETKSATKENDDDDDGDDDAEDPEEILF